MLISEILKMNRLFILSILLIFSSCESDAARDQRETREAKQRIELEEKRQEKAAGLAFQEEQKRIDREAKLGKERKEKIIYDKYINNSLQTGATPYAYCFGANKSCSDHGCSEIKVKTPYNSDVMVTIKKNDKVFRHAYIKAGNQYTFELPNGKYQPFFYYGKGWNPEKVMKETDCGSLKGGFVSGEDFSKDEAQILNNTILNYELILQQQGNFRTKPSDPEEAF